LLSQNIHKDIVVIIWHITFVLSQYDYRNHRGSRGLFLGHGYCQHLEPRLEKFLFFFRNRAWNLMQPDFKRAFNRVKLSRFLSNPKDRFQNFDFWIISQIFTLRHVWSCQFSTHSRCLIKIVVQRQRQMNGVFPVIISVILSLLLWGFDLIFMWTFSAQIMRETLKNIFHIHANPRSKKIHQIHNYQVYKQDSFTRSRITIESRNKITKGSCRQWLNEATNASYCWWISLVIVDELNLTTCTVFTFFF